MGLLFHFCTCKPHYGHCFHGLELEKCWPQYRCRAHLRHGDKTCPSRRSRCVSQSDLGPKNYLRSLCQPKMQLHGFKDRAEMSFLAGYTESATAVRAPQMRLNHLRMEHSKLVLRPTNGSRGHVLLSAGSWDPPPAPSSDMGKGLAHSGAVTGCCFTNTLCAAKAGGSLA